MNRQCFGMVAILLFACISLNRCNHAPEAAAEEEAGPAKVEHLQGAEPTRVTLTPDAAKRLDIKTAEVRDMVINGAQRRVMPYAAVLYDTDGVTWIYTNPKPLVYMRHRVVIDYIDDELVVLSDGPPSGTALVTVGAEELYGSELEFEEE